MLLALSVSPSVSEMGAVLLLKLGGGRPTGWQRTWHDLDVYNRRQRLKLGTGAPTKIALDVYRQ